ASARRGNPNPTSGNPRYQYYVVDNDDDDPQAPTYYFIDTLNGSWTRIANSSFNNLDDGYATMANTTQLFDLTWYQIKFVGGGPLPRLAQIPHPSPNSEIGTNGVIILDTNGF